MRPGGQLDRSLAALTIGLHSSLRKRAQGLAEATAEYDQQVQLPVQGQAALAWAFEDQPVTFRLPFLVAPAQRSVPFSVPHFTYGVAFDQPPAQLVRLTADVVSWGTNRRGWIVGAMVRIASQAPEAAADEQVSFTATAHLNFQGYASYPESAEEIV